MYSILYEVSYQNIEFHAQLIKCEQISLKYHTG
jgi:hypothetical protein